MHYVCVHTISHSIQTAVENIDLNDDDNPMLLPVYVNEIYSYLCELEITHQIHDDHLKDQKEVTHKMRAILIDWINEVHLQFRLLLETYYMTVSIIDRYLQVSVSNELR